MKYFLFAILSILFIHKTSAHFPFSGRYCYFTVGPYSTYTLGTQILHKPIYNIAFEKSAMIDYVPLPGQVFGSNGYFRNPVVTNEKIYTPNILIIKEFISNQYTKCIITNSKIIFPDILMIQANQPLFAFMRLTKEEVARYFEEQINYKKEKPKNAKRSFGAFKDLIKEKEFSKDSKKEDYLIDFTEPKGKKK